MEKKCGRCNLKFEFGDKNSRFCQLLNLWLCKNCNEDFDYKVEALKINFLKENPSYEIEYNIFPPPWDFVKYPEKTEGWIEFQKEFLKHPEYYSLITQLK